MKFKLWLVSKTGPPDFLASKLFIAVNRLSFLFFCRGFRMHVHVGIYIYGLTREGTVGTVDIQYF